MIDAPEVSPRRTRLRRWLIVTVCVLIPIAAHAVWDQVEATRMARVVRAIQDRGEPVNTADYRRPLDSDEQREASRLYFAAAILASPKPPPELRPDPPKADPFTRIISVLDDVVRESPSNAKNDPRVAQLQAVVDSVKPSMMLLDMATPLDFTRFDPAGSVYSPVYSYVTSDLVRLASMNALRTYVAIVRGDAAAAAASHLASVRLMRTFVGSSPFFTPRTLGGLSLLLERTMPNEAALVALQRAYEERSDKDGLTDMMFRRRALMLDAAWPYTYGRPSWVQRLRPGTLPGTWRPAETLGFLVMRPGLTHESIQMLRRLDAEIQYSRLPWPQKLDVTPAMGATVSRANVILLAQKVAAIRVAIATLAAERFRRAHNGEPPATLDVLVPQYLAAVPIDPFSGAPVRFRKDADAYVIYSVDANLRDDGGKLPAWRPDMKYERRAPDAAVDLGIRVPLHPVQ